MTTSLRNREDRLGLLPHLRPPADSSELRPVDFAVARCLLRGVELMSHLTADFSISFNGVVISPSRSLLTERNRDWLIYHLDMNAIVCVKFSNFLFLSFIRFIPLLFLVVLRQYCSCIFLVEYGGCVFARMKRPLVCLFFPMWTIAAWL